ncbi:MAG TPA: PHB depolymerase family esterase [Chloroflexia bacterium]|nr:PHB depolymerase family esterase [Chloroflexia bacterium]
MDNPTGSPVEINLAHVVRRSSASGEPDNRAPGLLLLHGRGADEYDLMGLEEGLDQRLTIISARAPFRLGGGFAWYDMMRVGEPHGETMQTSLQALREFIGGCVDAYTIDPARLYLMGFSQGAVMASAAALIAPEKIQGVIMHSGYIPQGLGAEAKPEALAGKPFFVAHGKYDDVIPVTFGRDASEYLTEHNARLTYQEYPIGHTISEESFYDLSEWLTGELDADH